MAIVTRVGKGSSLTNAEGDTNWNTLNGINRADATTSASITVADQCRTLELTGTTSAIAVTLDAIATISSADDSQISDFQTTIINTGDQIVTITSDAADTINGGTTSTTIVLNPDDSVVIQTASVATEWNVLKLTIADVQIQINTNTPIGIVSPYAGSSAPTGWLLCDASEVSTTTYAALYAVVGADAFGTDAAGNFFLPDLRGRTVLGVGTGDATDATAHALADKEGTETHTLDVSETPAHTHDLTLGVANDANVAGPNANSLGGHSGAGTSDTFDDAAATTGGGGAHNNLQPSLTLNYIIKI